MLASFSVFVSHPDSALNSGKQWHHFSSVLFYEECRSVVIFYLTFYSVNTGFKSKTLTASILPEVFIRLIYNRYDTSQIYNAVGNINCSRLIISILWSVQLGKKRIWSYFPWILCVTHVTATLDNMELHQQFPSILWIKPVLLIQM